MYIAKGSRNQRGMKLVDDGVNTSQQLRILMNDAIDLKVFTDSRPLLEIIGCSSQVAEKALRQSVAYIKQSLKDKELDCLAT